MHDPDVVAFDIPRPWPQRSHWHDTKPGDRRWQIRHHHTCPEGKRPATCDGCQGRTNARMFPWWRPGSYSRFWTLAGRGFFWPALITIWHREPGGHDSFTVCRNRKQRPDGTWRFTRAWQWHVWHWRLQIHPYQWARRRLLTRCAWCGNRDRKGDPVNHSLSWHPRRARWWQGERELYHEECTNVYQAHGTCLCEVPGPLEHSDYGICANCGKFRPWRKDGYVPDEATRLLAGLPPGSRIPPALQERLTAIYAARRAAESEASG